MNIAHCWCCKKQYEHYGLYGCDAVTICPECKKNRPEDVEKIYMHNKRYWNGCDIGYNVGACPSCNYNHICDIQDKQIHDMRGVAGEP